MIEDIEKKEYGSVFCTKRNKINYRRITTLADALTPAVDAIKGIQQKKADENRATERGTTTTERTRRSNAAVNAHGKLEAKMKHMDTKICNLDAKIVEQAKTLVMEDKLKTLNGRFEKALDIYEGNLKMKQNSTP